MLLIMTMNPKLLKKKESAEMDEIQVNPETLDDGSVCVNFDVYDKENDEVIRTGGYVLICKEEDEKTILHYCF